MTDQKNKRTALTVQDVINGQPGRPHAKFKSGYTGPKKAPATQTPAAVSGTIPDTLTKPHRSGGILDYAWVAYCVVLAIALSSALIAYGTGSGNGKRTIYYPSDVFTISGVVKDIFSDYRHGGLGSGYREQMVTADTTAATAATATADADTADETENNEETNALLGESAGNVTPNSTAGATMTLDVGTSVAGYTSATSHEELLTQLDKALAASDSEFVGSKLAYEDEESKTLIGYPQSVVEHFTKYMADNPDKRANFLAEIKDASLFSAKNGSAYIVKLPLLQFTINMGYDGTTISISGFADQHMDSGQSAVVSPLLPCMYTIHAETEKGSQTSEVECNMNEGNLKINIGVTN